MTRVRRDTSRQFDQKADKHSGRVTECYPNSPCGKARQLIQTMASDARVWSFGQWRRALRTNTSSAGTWNIVLAGKINRAKVLAHSAHARSHPHHPPPHTNQTPSSPKLQQFPFRPSPFCQLPIKYADCVMKMTN